ncbi:hypothetical protein GCM10029978_074650 [Actinoallomurus acanthiterrae]
MALRIGDEWIGSDRCPQVVKAVPGGSGVLPFRPGRYTKEEASTAMIRAEHGDLTSDPAVEALAS